MKALAEGQKKVRHEGKKALADVRPRNKVGRGAVAAGHELAVQPLQEVAG
jgi:hypothetical protein